MIVIDEASSERSPLKSPSSPVTARYDSPNGTNTQPQQISSPPPYLPTQGGNLNSGPSSSSPYHPHPHPHHHRQHPQSLSPPAHPHHSPYAGPNRHPRNDQITLEEDRVIRSCARQRFFGAFLIAWLIVLAWTGIIRGITYTVIVTRNGVTANTESWWDRPLPAIRWPHAYPSPQAVVAKPCPTVTVTALPDGRTERFLSVAYPPPAQTSS